MNKRLFKELKKKSINELRHYYVLEEKKALRDIDRGIQTREAKLARKDFWLQFKQSIRNGMDAMESFRNKWENAVILPWAGAAEYAAIQSLSNI